jgi:ankyrin repeat protein
MANGFGEKQELGGYDWSKGPTFSQFPPPPVFNPVIRDIPISPQLVLPSLSYEEGRIVFSTVDQIREILAHVKELREDRSKSDKEIEDAIKEFLEKKLEENAKSEAKELNEIINEFLEKLTDEAALIAATVAIMRMEDLILTQESGEVSEVEKKLKEGEELEEKIEETSESNKKAEKSEDPKVEDEARNEREELIERLNESKDKDLIDKIAKEANETDNITHVIRQGKIIDSLIEIENIITDQLEELKKQLPGLTRDETVGNVKKKLGIINEIIEKLNEINNRIEKIKEKKEFPKEFYDEELKDALNELPDGLRKVLEEKIKDPLSTPGQVMQFINKVIDALRDNFQKKLIREWNMLNGDKNEFAGIIDSLINRRNELINAREKIRDGIERNNITIIRAGINDVKEIFKKDKVKAVEKLENINERLTSLISTKRRLISSEAKTLKDKEERIKQLEDINRRIKEAYDELDKFLFGLSFFSSTCCRIKVNLKRRKEENGFGIQEYIKEQKFQLTDLTQLILRLTYGTSLFSKEKKRDRQKINDEDKKELKELYRIFYLNYLMAQVKSYCLFLRDIEKELRKTFVSELVRSVKSKNTANPIKGTRVIYFDRIMKSEDEMIFKAYPEFKQRCINLIEKGSIKGEFSSSKLFYHAAETFRRLSLTKISIYNMLCTYFYAPLIAYLDYREKEDKVYKKMMETNDLQLKRQAFDTFQYLLSKEKSFLEGIESEYSQNDIQTLMLDFPTEKSRLIKDELIDGYIDILDRSSKYMEMYSYTSQLRKIKIDPAETKRVENVKKGIEQLFTIILAFKLKNEQMQLLADSFNNYLTALSIPPNKANDEIEEIANKLAEADIMPKSNFMFALIKPKLEREVEKSNIIELLDKYQKKFEENEGSQISTEAEALSLYHYIFSVKQDFYRYNKNYKKALLELERIKDLDINEIISADWDLSIQIAYYFQTKLIALKNLAEGVRRELKDNKILDERECRINRFIVEYSLVKAYETCNKALGILSKLKENLELKQRFMTSKKIEAYKDAFEVQKGLVLEDLISFSHSDEKNLMSEINLDSNIQSENIEDAELIRGIEELYNSREPINISFYTELLTKQREIRTEILNKWIFTEKDLQDNLKNLPQFLSFVPPYYTNKKIRWAASKNHFYTLQYILGDSICRKRTNINSKNKDGRTALHHAVVKGSKEIVRLLLKNGADVNVKDSDGKTPLILASMRGNVEIMKLLLENNADPNIRDKEERTAILYAIFRRIISNDAREIAEILLKYNADVNVADKKGITPLYFAILCVDFDLIKMLIENGADINAKEKTGQTILYATIISVKKENEDKIKEILKYLLEKGANPNETIRLKLPLKTLLKDGIISVLNYDAYKARGLKDEDDIVFFFSPLSTAVVMKNLELVKLLVEHGAEINRNQLSSAVAVGSKEIVLYLIEKGADVNRIDDMGFAPIHNAVLKKVNSEILTLLLEHGANPDIKDPNGETPLFYAVRNHDPEKVKILLDHGARLNVTNNKGETPYIIGMQVGFQPISLIAGSDDSKPIVVKKGKK